jgi:hypothetical protein
MQCDIPISKGIHDFSHEVYGVPLCIHHQILIYESMASQEAKALFLALKINKVPAVLEYSDGFKTVDIAIPGRLYIEVDEDQNRDADQALTDLLRTYHSWSKERIPTVRIPNALINNPYLFKKAVSCLSEMCLFVEGSPGRDRIALAS